VLALLTAQSVFRREPGLRQSTELKLMVDTNNPPVIRHRRIAFRGRAPYVDR
jgi:hypothetical protein